MFIWVGIGLTVEFVHTEAKEVPTMSTDLTDLSFFTSLWRSTTSVSDIGRVLI